MNIKKQFILLPCLMASLFSYAQTAIVPVGGDVSEVSYTIGQIVCEPITEATGSVMVGVQLPYEIYTVGIDEYPLITLSMSVYPNPTTHHVILRIDNETSSQLTDLQGFLYDINGKIVLSSLFRETETQINMESLPVATYFLQVINQKEVIKTFKIVKY